MKTSALTLIIVMISMSCITNWAKTSDKEITEAKKALQPHKDCYLCHMPHHKDEKVLLNKPLQELCASCHQERIGKGEHKVGIKPVFAVEGLPLDAEGKMTCITCHDPHGAAGHEKLMRAPSFSDLCKKCHKRY